MTDDELIEGLDALLEAHGLPKDRIARLIALARIGAKVKEPGKGFFDAIQRSMEKSWEKDGPDEMTDIFRQWNAARKTALPTPGPKP